MVDNSQENGIFAVITSILASVISLSTVQVLVSIIASCVAIVSGIFAINYYWLKSNEIKKRKKL